MSSTTSQSPAVADVWPLTPLQSGLLFHSLWERETGADPTYLLQFAVEVSGRVDGVRLRQAAAALLADHDNLRVGFFAEGDSEPVQFVVGDLDPDVEVVELAGIPAVPAGTWSRHPAVAAVAAAEWARGFDPQRPPLVRVRLLRVDAARAVLLLTVHHLVLDGWSGPLLLAELLDRATAVDPALHPNPDVPDYLDYLDVVLPPDDPDHGPAATRTVLATLEDLDGPTLVAPAGRVGAVERRVLTSRRGAELRSRAKELGVSPAAFVSAVWGVVLGRLTDSADVVFGLTVAGRGVDLPGVEELIGLLGNTLPFRVPARPGEEFAEVARAAHRHHGVLADAAAADLRRVQHAFGDGPLFDSLLVVENYPGDVSGWRSADGSVAVTGAWARDAVHFPLALVVELGGAPRFELTVRSDLAGGAAAVESLLHSVLDRVLDEPRTIVADLGVLSGEPVEHLDGGPSQGPDLDRLLDEVLAARADEVAVVDGDRLTTTRELHATAGELAEELRSGAGTVGVLAPRSVVLVAGVLAALRTGRPFLALDPEVPLHRLIELVEDAAVNDLVVHPDAAGTAAHLGFTGGGSVVHRNGSAAGHRGSTRDGSAAYVVFTSGTTGRPKGCVNTRGGLALRLAWMRDRYGITADDVVLHKTPVGFDVSVWELVLPW